MADISDTCEGRPCIARSFLRHGFHVTCPTPALPLPSWLWCCRCLIESPSHAGDGEGDANIALKASSWNAWMQLQVNTEWQRAELLKSLGGDEKEIAEHR